MAFETINLEENLAIQRVDRLSESMKYFSQRVLAQFGTVKYSSGEAMRSATSPFFQYLLQEKLTLARC